MSKPPEPPPPRVPPPPGFQPPGPWQAPRHWGNSFLLGILAGVVAIGLYVYLTLAVGPLLSYGNTPLSPLLQGVLGWGFPLVYLAGAIVLTSLPATMRFGAGLLIAIGVSMLIAAGVCFAILSGFSGANR
ncbi:hypothetical protein [Sinomonas mesophila]|uniref:hypothetical protein n=1 Tax=Sinomonas mesophila TaxID=1531955 RepID=UPI0009848B10|nr:hypothetical protein [Sinomonas mesophila]